MSDNSRCWLNYYGVISIMRLLVCTVEDSVVRCDGLNRSAFHHVPRGSSSFTGSHERDHWLSDHWFYCPPSESLGGVADSGMYRRVCKAEHNSVVEVWELCDRWTSVGGSFVFSCWATSPSDEAPLLATHLNIQASSITEGWSWWVAKSFRWIFQALWYSYF